jgi:hypothetical protein
MTKEEKVSQIREQLEKDFLSRGEHFVYSREEGRLRWEKNLNSAALSSYVSSAETKEEALKNAYSVAREMITAMAPPVPVKVSVNGEGSYTNGKVLNVGTAHFDDNDISLAEKMDAFVADESLLERAGNAAGNLVSSNAGATMRVFESLGL